MAAPFIDSSALLVYFRDQPGADHVQEALEAASRKGAAVGLSEVNYAEFAARILNDDGPAALAQVKRSLVGLPIVLFPTTREIAEVAGLLAHEHSLSIGSAFALATARARKTELLTADEQFSSMPKDAKVRLIV